MVLPTAIVIFPGLNPPPVTSMLAPPVTTGVDFVGALVVAVALAVGVSRVLAAEVMAVSMPPGGDCVSVLGLYVVVSPLPQPAHNRVRVRKSIPALRTDFTLTDSSPCLPSDAKAETFLGTKEVLNPGISFNRLSF
jgi:hypothetical protein